MKPVFKGLALNEKDNTVSALAKGMANGYLKYSMVAIPVIGILGVIGKFVNRNDEVEVFEAEFEEEL